MSLCIYQQCSQTSYPDCVVLEGVCNLELRIVHNSEMYRKHMYFYATPITTPTLSNVIEKMALYVVLDREVRVYTV